MSSVEENYVKPRLYEISIGNDNEILRLKFGISLIATSSIGTLLLVMGLLLPLRLSIKGKGITDFSFIILEGVKTFIKEQWLLFID
ncbi:MAG: hypothetical protein HQL44_08940 [Alphaproteobacteria bacterium]|nr:hypothetical protein [Alphaproteobacteria bacterium]